jgi:DNA-binding transcriptional LysR family regulator
VAIEIRHMRYVVAVAEHGTFSRAAERLGIAQPALSQQILKVERELGVELFLRHPRGATPTAAGEALILDARTALSAFDGAIASAERLTRGETGELHVGFAAAGALELTPQILTAFAERHPRSRCTCASTLSATRRRASADRTADVSFVRPPLGTRGLWFEPLGEEPRVVAVAASHRLAGRASVSVAELLEEPMVGSPGRDAVANAFWLLDDHRDGVPARIAATADTYETELQIVAAGRAITISCAASARYFARPGVVYVPVDDIAPSQVALAHRAGASTTLVRNFLAVAREVRDGRPG